MIIRYQKGFTLIELLVVVAIIGLLASVVMSSVGSSRDKGKDAAVKENLISARNAIELYYSNNGTYGSTNWFDPCPTTGTGNIFADPNVQAALSKAIASAGTPPVGNNSNVCYLYDISPVNAWTVAVSLKSDPNLSFCINSYGQAKIVNAFPEDAVVGAGYCLGG